MLNNVTNNKTEKTFNYSLTVNGIDVPDFFRFEALATNKQYINAIALIEKIIGDVNPSYFFMDDDIKWEGEYCGFDWRFSREYRHDITKADLIRLLVEIQNVILTFKHEDEKGA